MQSHSFPQTKSLWVPMSTTHQKNQLIDRSNQDPPVNNENMQHLALKLTLRTSWFRSFLERSDPDRNFHNGELCTWTHHQNQLIEIGRAAVLEEGFESRTEIISHLQFHVTELYKNNIRVAPDIQLAQYPLLFARYPARKTVLK